MTDKQVNAWRKRVYRFLTEVDGLTVEDYQTAREFFSKHGVDFAHVDKGWRFWTWVADRPQQVILWCGPRQVREYLDAPSTLLAEMKRLEKLALTS